MVMIFMELKEALKVALDFEKKGYDIYFQASLKAKNEVVRTTFEYLAKQEHHHIKEIADFLKKNDLPLKLGGDLPLKTQDFFNKTFKKFKKKTVMSQDELKLYKSAMELEEAAYEFYKTQAAIAKSVDAKKFFEFLVSQENAHFALLQKSLDYIRDPDKFFAGEENWNFEG